MRCATGALLLCLAGCGTQPGASPLELPAPPSAAERGDWRRLATAADRGRLRRWRDAWVTALAQAREAAGPALAMQGALLAIDAALPDPIPPNGAYRCRTLKLGRRGAVGTGFTVYPWFDCRVTTAADGEAQLVKLTGSQRQVGVIYRADADRAVFLGTLMLGDEARAYAYGVDGTRDVAGWIERVGARRWRLVMPYPAFESTLDLLELIPAG